jgi:hypothetical protein
LQSETHEALYRRLSDVTAGFKNALGEKDTGTLVWLAETNNIALDKIKQKGFSRDPRLIHLLKAVKEQVDEMTAQIKAEKDKIGLQLKAAGNRKKLAAAYGLQCRK